MVEPVVGLVVEKLKDDTTGLLALLPTCPFSSGTTPPELPTNLRIIGGFSEMWAARGELPREELDKGPMLIVRQAAEVELAFMPADSPLQSPINITLHFASVGSRTHVEQLIAHAVLRTAQRVLALAFASIPENDPEYARAGGYVQRPERVTYLPPFDEGSDAVNSLACVIPFPVFDAWALGAPVN